MMTTQKRCVAAPSEAGFSMIDVLVAIVVLATALLALAALQGGLTRNAADSRARSQIAAYAEGLMDEMRSSGYSSIASATITPLCTAAATRQQAQACSAQTAAGVTNLQTAITATQYYSTGSGFSSATPSSSATIYGQYQQVHVATTWTDAGGQARTFQADTIISPILEDLNTKNLDDQTLLPTTAAPIVRQYNPGLTAGVIPIARGDGNSTAATNPQPEILGKSNNQFIGGVSYNVLTYGADDNTSNHETQILQNVATRVIRCNCKYGAGISSGIYAQAYQASYWDSSQQKYITPSTYTGTSFNTGQDTSSTMVNGVVAANQDTNCNICCRDHNDSTNTIRFNPWTTDNSHYRWASTGASTMTLVPSSDTSNAFVDACRLIIVDGVYRVTTDMQNYFFGLVGTDSSHDTGVPSGSNSTSVATSPLPVDTGTGSGNYTTDYQTFVVNYLTSYGGASVSSASAVATTTTLTNANYPLNSPSGPASNNAASGLFVTAGLASSGGVSVPNSIDINYVSTGNFSNCLGSGSKSDGTQDCRYMHARGLYIDHLESVSLTAINNALSTCSGTIQSCLLPLLPFTTINLTQLADWSEDHTASGQVSDVVASNLALTGGNPDQPLRGVVSALSTGTNSTKDTAVAEIGLSNSGVIGTSLQSGVSDTDETTNLKATQVFNLASGGVNATTTSTLGFNIVLSNPSPNSTNSYPIGLGTNIPSVSWAGVSSYYTSGSATTLPECTTSGTTSPDQTDTYYGTTKSKCGTVTANSIIAANVPAGSTAGVQVTVQNYNVQTTGTGGTRVTDSGCKVGSVSPTPTSCTVYKILSVSVNGTAVPGWSSVTSNTNGTQTGTSTKTCHSVNGIPAASTIQVPSGLSGTSTSPDSLQIVLTKDTSNSYTPDQYGNSGGAGGICSSVGGGKYTYTAYSCCQ